MNNMEIWTLDIKNQSWVEDTPNQVNFIIKTLQLNGNEKILDLACGFGRHSLLLAKLGYDVTGVDITKDYIADAKNEAQKMGLKINFICDDIRNINFSEKFDVVLNLADGAIGYLENDEENLKIFDVISNSLKNGGKHFMDICNADHAEYYFPKKHWEIGEKTLALAQFDWDAHTRQMRYAGWNIPYGKIANKPIIDIENTNPTRLYSLNELKNILGQRGMKITSSFSNYYGKELTNKELQLMVYSQKL
jgi:SAM-dependent methyltransferase